MNRPEILKNAKPISKKKFAETDARISKIMKEVYAESKRMQAKSVEHSKKIILNA